jgi:hypothetical protein
VNLNGAIHLSVFGGATKFRACWQPASVWLIEATEQKMIHHHFRDITMSTARGGVRNAAL